MKPSAWLQAFALAQTLPTPHMHCGATVDARGLHGLACRKSTPRHIRHSQLNDIIWRAVKKAQIPASKEPIRLLRHDGKRPDGATLVPWTRGRTFAWDVTLLDTFTASHIQFTSSSACAAADKAAANKTANYVELTSTHHFVSIAVETSGAWSPQSTEFIEEFGRRISTITNEPLEMAYLFQGSQLHFREIMQSPFATHFPRLNFSPGRSILIGKTI